MSASSFGRNIPVLSKSRAILIVKTDVLSNTLSDRREQLVPKNKGSQFHRGFFSKVGWFGFFFEDAVWLQHTETGFTVWWHFFFLNHHTVDLEKE